MNINDFFKGSKNIRIDNDLKKLINDIKPNEYSINRDGTVNLNRSVHISSNLTECPVKFNVINGNFIWHMSNLNDIKNLPNVVYGNLIISYNDIDSLIDLPTTYVSGIFNCSGNKIDDLRGSPKKCGSLIAINCGLTSLEGSPKHIEKDFLVNNNNLTSLEHGPTSIKGTYNCKNNNLKSLDKDIEKSINSVANKFLHDFEIKINKKEFNLNDKIIYKHPNSRYSKMIGFIISISEMPNYKLYTIKFEPKDNPSLDKDAIIFDISSNYLKKYNKKDEIPTENFDEYRELLRKKVEKSLEIKFNINDEVIYKNPDSKYNGFKGRVESYSNYDEMGKWVKKPIYVVKFNFNENPGLIDVVMTANKDKGYVNIKKIHADDLESTIIEPIPKNEHNELRYDDFKFGEDIVYKNKDSVHNNLKGKVIYVNNMNKTINIEVIDNLNRKFYIYKVLPNELEKIKNKDSNDISKNKENDDFKYKVGDKIIYISHKDDNDNKEFHLSKGVISLLNKYNGNNYGTYDVKFDVGLNYPRSVYYVHERNLMPYTTEFKKSDKVIYIGDKEKYKDSIGIINSVDDDNKYNVTFNIDGKKTYLYKLDEKELSKFIKPLGNEASIGDDIIYVKPDSIHFGCVGVVTDYIIDNPKPYKIEIKSKDRKIVKINTTDDNLEIIPSPRKFKKDDIIRYLNDGSKYDGLIGKIIKRKDDNYYNITLKDKNNNVYITTTPDHLILLEEASDSKDLKYGDVVKYTKKDSKHYGRIGTFQGERFKDGNKQLTVQFDDDQGWVKLYVEPGTLDAYNGPLPKKTTTYTTYNTTTKKKKKKEPEKPLKPILVYNRRPIAKKTKNPIIDEEG